jgi:hypothetical protein
MRNSKKLRSFTVCSLLLGSLSLVSLASAMPGEVSFTPTGLRLSIMSIVLSATDANGNPTSQATLYTCPGADEEACLVDVTDQDALDAIALSVGKAKVDVGTYDTVSMNLCAAGKNGMTPAPGYVRGTFTVPSEHKTYITGEGASSPYGIRELVAGDNSDAGFAKIGNWSCNTKSVHMPSPITVSADVATDLTVVVDPQLIAFSTSNVSGGMGGCRGAEDGQARGICVSYPSIVPLVGEATPDLARFLIAHHKSDPDLILDSKANAYVVVVRGAGMGDPLTAFVRPYYSETSAQTSSNTPQDAVYGGPAYFGETLVGSVHVNPDGGIDFTTGGSLDGNSAIFKDFTLDDHKGTVDTRTEGSYQYHAIPLAADSGPLGDGGASGASGVGAGGVGAGGVGAGGVGAGGVGAGGVGAGGVGAANAGAGGAGS